MNFNDEIVSIEILDDEEMIDIEVSDDHLFHGDGILVSNSIGIPGVCDLMLAGMRNEETDSIGQIIYKQLKNRFRKMQYKPKFVLGCDFDQQLFYDLSQSEQNLVENTAAVQIDSAKIQEKFQSNKRRKGRFENVDVGE
jgi:hypothetical protein